MEHFTVLLEGDSLPPGVELQRLAQPNANAFRRPPPDHPERAQRRLHKAAGLQFFSHGREDGINDLARFIESEAALLQLNRQPVPAFALRTRRSFRRAPIAAFLDAAGLVARRQSAPHPLL